MVGEKSSRKYQLRRRAETMEATRLRITQAAVELHGTIGPARTTIAGIAERAGVQRHTVYRHFPTDEDLFEACTTYYWGRHPWPDPASWQEVDDPERRFVRALSDLYEFYADVEPMLTNVLRDAGEVPVAQQALATFTTFLDDVTRVLLGCCAPARGRKRFAEGIARHAAAFPTWQSLVRQNRIPATEAVRLMLALVQAAAGLPRSARDS